MTKVLFAIGLAVASCFAVIDQSVGDQEPETRPEVLLGERLFKETRFSQLFYAISAGNPNKGIEEGEPVLDFIDHFDGNKYPSPFSGQTMSCASCHMVDQAFAGDNALGMRIYTDFSTFSPIPARDSVGGHTLRNSQAVVIPVNQNGPNFFHWDGEFNSLESLVYAGLGGRNMGWKPDEKRLAHHHLFHIIYGDDGSGDLAAEFGGVSYREVFLSEGPGVPDEFRLPESLRLDVSQSDPHQVVMRVAFLIAEYMRDSQLQKDESGAYIGSPYDLFLIKNNLPRQPMPGETDKAYAERLRVSLDNLDLVEFVSTIDNEFKTHDQEFSFGPTELAGLKVFLTANSDARQNQRAGACVQCHSPPHFTDFGFHNIGVGQLQYERSHGFFSYRELMVPDLESRNEHMDLYGTPDFQHPNRLRLLGSKPNKEDPRAADLGLWNVYLNPDYPHLQADIETVLRRSLPSLELDDMTPNEKLSLTAGMSKTPTLRNLGHTAPYFRDGHARDVNQVLGFYIATSRGAKQGLILNPDPKLLKVNLVEADKEPLIKFLESLNEDYD